MLKFISLTRKKRRGFIVLVLVFMGITARADDRTDVLAVLNKEEAGFNQFDPKMVANLFSADADWWNPFGVHLVGRSEIEKFLEKLFRRPGYRSGSNTSSIVFEIKFPAKDIAVTHGYEESAGQVDDDTGKKMAPRKSHYLDVLAKRDGQWLIVSEMIMDEK
jgi:uncharacterized protein (TIGR02246 family)